jgi:hypothetical protein
VLRPLFIGGVLILTGYFGLFAILQAPVLWYALRPDPIRSLSPEIFAPVNAAFPDTWVNLERTDPLALLVVPFYVVVLTLVTLPLVYLVRRLARIRTRARPSQARNFLLVVLGITLAIMLLLLVVRGLLSTDVYSYAWYSRMLAVHGASPMTHAPAEFPPDAEGAFYWIGWPEEPSVYGPVWTAVSTLFFQIGNGMQGTFAAQLASIRVLADLAHLVNGWLVWCIAGLFPVARSTRQFTWKRNRRPVSTARIASHSHWIARGARASRSAAFGPRAAALLFYLWNPLLIIEFVGSGHNDVLMLTFVLLAIWLHLKGWWPVAAGALVCATLVKLPAIFFVPGYLWFLFWHRYNGVQGQNVPDLVRAALVRPLQAVGVMALTAVALYLPFWEGPRTLLPPFSGPASRLYLHTLGYDIVWNGPQIAAILLGVEDGRGPFMESLRAFLDAILRPLGMALFAVAALAVTWRARTFPRLLISWGWVALAAAVTQGWYWPWYASWGLTIAAVAPSRRLRIATFVLGISSLLLYVEEQVLAQHFRIFLDWSGVFIMLPPLLYIVFSWLTSRRRPRPVRRLPAPAQDRSPVENMPGA